MELNQKIHKWLGKCWHEFNNDCICQVEGCVADNDFRNQNPDYTVNPAAMLGLIETVKSRWFKQNPHETQFWQMVDCGEHGWRVDVNWGHHDGDVPILFAAGDTLPMAVALAVEKLIDAEENHSR